MLHLAALLVGRDQRADPGVRVAGSCLPALYGGGDGGGPVPGAEERDAADVLVAQHAVEGARRAGRWAPTMRS